jgi:Carboxypeptidase regulatory-like domain/TonB-dependent Receptor Plug Domain
LRFLRAFSCAVLLGLVAYIPLIHAESNDGDGLSVALAQQQMQEPPTPSTPTATQTGASLTGVVSDPSGKPVAGASVALQWKLGEKTTTTNVRGEYKLMGLAAGDYQLKVTAAGFSIFETDASLAEGQGLEMDAPLEPPPAATQTGLAPVLAPKDSPVHPREPIQALPASPAQKISGASLNGVVTDQSGAVIPLATVTVTGTEGMKTGNTNERGEYLVPGLAAGVYGLKIEAPGFAPYAATDVTLAANQSLELDASLQPPTATTNVTVEGQTAGQVQTESAHIEGTITEKEVLNAPLNGRNFTQLIALTPGVSNQTGQDEAKVGVAGSVKYSVNGGRVEYNNFDVDGSDVLNAGLNGAESTLMVYPSLDAIQEVKVLTSNYGAMYGRTASGTVIVTTKSGTPQFHGNAYDFVRNEVFNARNYFDETAKAPLYRRQDFGGTIGGPLYVPGVFNSKKDKTFFFFSEEFRVEKSPQGPGGSSDFNQAVPTLQERPHNCINGAGSAFTCGDFSDVCPPSADTSVQFSFAQYPDCPAGFNKTVVNGQLVGATFNSNQVPVDPNSAGLIGTGLIPLPNSSTGCNSSLAGGADPNTGQPFVPCYVAVISLPTYWREELFRLDHSLTQNLRASFRYIHDSWDTTVVTPQWGYVQNSFPTVENRLNGPGVSMVARLTDTISPSLLNEFVLSYVDAHITLQNIPGPGASLQRPSALNLGYIFNNGFGGKPPGIVIAGTNAAYGGNGFVVDPSYVPWEHTNPTYGLGDNVSKQLGKHTLQFGLQVSLAQRSETNGAIGAATGDLQGLLTFSNQNSVASSGNAFADMLLQQPNSGFNAIKSFQQDSDQLRYHNNYWIAEPYLQDDWHATHRLTLNLGLRFSLFGNYHEKNLNAWNWVASQFDHTLAATVQVAPPSSGTNGGYLQTIGGTPLTLDPTNPQGGLNPAITNGLVQCGKNGVPDSCMSSHLFNPAPRVGFAWDPRDDGKTSIRGGYGIFFEHGTAKEANTGSLEGSAPNVLTMTDTFPLTYQSIGQDAAGDQVAYPLDVTSLPTKTVWPYVQQWSLSAQHQFSKDTVGTLAYVGSKGTHLTAELQVNQLPTPPAFPDSGILLNGNPYTAGQPITAADCNIQPNGGYIVGPNRIPVVGPTSNSPGEPAWVNMNAACFGVLGVSPQNPANFRPYIGFQRIFSLQNIGDSQYHALQATVRRAAGPVTVGASYTYSHSLDDSSDRSDASFVNSADIKSSWASSNYDQRHLVNVNYIYDIPHLSRIFEHMVSYRANEETGNPDVKAPAQSESHFLHQLLDGWQFSGITVFQSGTPFSVVNGGSNTGVSVLDNAGVANGAGAGSFPDVVGNPKSDIPSAASNGRSVGPLLLNPEAFAAPQGLTFGDAGRNFLNNPHRLNFDMTLQKMFKLTEGSSLELRAEAFNIFNHTEFRIFNPNLGDQANNTISCYGTQNSNYSAAGDNGSCLAGSAFLHPVDAHRPRTIQLGLKLSF